MAFSPDSQTLVTASDDGSAILWDLTDRSAPRQLGIPLTGPHGPMYTVAVSPAGKRLTTATDENAVITWDTSSVADVRRRSHDLACAYARGGLDRALWDTYAPGTAYVNSCL